MRIRKLKDYIASVKCTSHAPLSILAIGSLVPQEIARRLFDADRFPGVQTQRFQQSLAKALSTSETLEVRWVSTPPITDWSTIRWTGFYRWNHHGTGTGKPDWVMPVFNVVLLKQLFILLGCLLPGLVWGIKGHGRPRVVLLADAAAPHLLAALIIGRIFRCPVVGTITDMPGLIELPDNPLKHFLRPLDRGLVHRMLAALDGLVVLSDKICEDFFPGKKALVMHGFAEPLILDDDLAFVSCQPFTVGYSGAISKEYGLEFLLKSFQLTDPSIVHRLIITGRGQDDELIAAAALCDPRIDYRGFLLGDVLRKTLSEVDLFINPRPVNSEYSRYSFPSKLFSYMASGRPVLTTKFPNLPGAFCRHLVLPADETPHAFATAINTVASWNPTRRRAFGEESRQFVFDHYSIPIQGERIQSFLNRIWLNHKEAK